MGQATCTYVTWCLHFYPAVQALKLPTQVRSEMIVTVVWYEPLHTPHDPVTQGRTCAR